MPHKDDGSIWKVGYIVAPLLQDYCTRSRVVCCEVEKYLSIVRAEQFIFTAILPPASLSIFQETFFHSLWSTNREQIVDLLPADAYFVTKKWKDKVSKK